MALIRYAVANAANACQTSASGRAALLTERPKRMPLPVTPERQRSPSPTSSQSEDESDSDSEIEQTDSEWSPVMDRYSSADYDPALYATSEVDDAEDFYDADPSQPAVTAGAVSTYLSFPRALSYCSCFSFSSSSRSSSAQVKRQCRLLISFLSHSNTRRPLRRWAITLARSNQAQTRPSTLL